MGAGWYCAHCGQALADINVADRAASGPWAHRGRPLALLGVLVLAAAGLAATRALRPTAVPPPAPVTATATAPVVAGAPTVEPEAGTPTGIPSPRIVTATPVPAASVPGAPAAGATPTLAPGEPIWRIPFLARQPRIDGALDEWRSPPVDITAVVFGQRYWQNSRDLSAQAVAGFDRELLFLGVRVIDDVFSQPAQGLRLFLGDSLELQVDADRVGDGDTAAYNGDDFQLGLSPGNFADRQPEAHMWRPTGTAVTGISLAARRLDDGYVLEAAIPWRLFRVDTERTPVVGLALNVSDNDSPEPAQLTMVSSTPRRSWGDPRTFGTLVLEASGAASPPTGPAQPTAQQGPPP
jgi:hypothetical protein